jgi:SAM-dependent methyltransferase
MFSESAELYDAIHQTFKDYATEADRIAGLIREHHPSAQAVLDVGCGTGEHLKHLRALGFEADGLDLDPRLLAVARRKVPMAQFFAGDMSDFDLSKRYDVVACLFSSIGYLQTISRVTSALRAFRRHLAPDGLVVVEPWFAPGVLRTGKGATRSAAAASLRIERSSYTSIRGNVSTLTFEYEIDDGQGVRHAKEVHELGLFTPREMLDAFEAVGLSATHDPVGVFDNRGLYLARVVA